VNPTTATRPRLGDRISPAFLDAHRRRRLINGLAEAIAERGYKATTVADVVRATGCARNTFYENFGSKDDASRALVDAVCPALSSKLHRTDIERDGLGVLIVEVAALWESGSREDAIHRLTYAADVVAEVARSVTPPGGAEEMRCSLPPGRHGLERDFVRANQRHRLLEALSRAVDEKGYRGVTIADVAGRARVSRRTFYEHFGSASVAASALLDESTGAGTRCPDPDTALGALCVEVVAAGWVHGVGGAEADAVSAGRIIEALRSQLEGGREMLAEAA
jgi:AcrR family transcriptional regulator